ncbi:SIT4 phosphatase-associated protein-domain-containing protein [Umbelopsis sp. PMI_123]|nr:SIT4 phosphatase-associated protein-domain-containing protein [Umbelopsis sp. PMI_123]
MFWRFGFHNPSAIDSLLDKEDVSLDELFEDDDLLQEAKTHNQKLINFLCAPDILKQLVHLITADDLPDHQSLKYPYLASEILSCEIPALVDAIVLDHLDLLSKSWSIFDTDDTLGTLQTGYFCKVNAVLLAKRTSEMIAFIKSRDNIIDKMISHLDDASPVGDLLLTLVRCEELPEGQGIVQWLSEQKLLIKLIDRLEPHRDPETHANAQQLISDIIRMSQTSNPESPTIGTNALIYELKSKEIMTRLADYMLDGNAPNATSSLINGVTIIIDFIRHNNSDFELDQMLVMGGGTMLGGMQQGMLSSVNLGEMLQVMADRTESFQKLLVEPRSVSDPVPTTTGPQVPLGFERLKICELYAELLHCSNMSNLNLPASSDAENKTQMPIMVDFEGEQVAVGDYLKMQYVKHRVLPACLDLFFSFQWNNFLHYVVYDTLHQICNGRMDFGYNRELVISVFKDGQLTQRIVEAQKLNDELCAKAKGRRLGYMGHLTFISDEVIKVLASYPDEIYAVVKDSLDLDAWDNYINGPLRETKLRDRVPLGGIKPAGGLDGLEHDMMTEDITRQIAGVKGDFPDEDDEDEEDGMGGWIR